MPLLREFNFTANEISNLMSHFLRRPVRLLGFCIAILGCHLAVAQVPTSSPVAPAPVGGSPHIVRSLWFEAIITLVMVGIALFVICRSSNRS